MELFELLEWLLPAGNVSGIQPGTKSISGEEFKSEDDLFSFIQAVLQPYPHAFSILIGMADTNGVIAQWWLQKEGAFNLGNLPDKVKEYYLKDDIAGVMKLETPDRSDALKSVLYNGGVMELLIIPLGNTFRNFGFVCLLSDQRNTFSQSLQSKLNEYTAGFSVACLKLLLTTSLKNVQQDYLTLEDVASIEDGKLIGNTLKPVMQLVRQVAPTDATVLLTGETGTGKELLAESIHYNSQRRDKDMIKVNCAALPAQLIESELFGHEKGAFTGALQRRTGKFEMADGGTLFLDEIGELPLELQAKLLRAIQEKEIERLGGSRAIKVDVRIVAATNRILEDEVRAGRFRQDLYYRLFVFPIHLPALRERKEDIPLLLRYFTEKAANKYGKVVKHINRASLATLVNYNWPGNIREMEHMVERAVISATSPAITITAPDSQQIKASDISPPPLLSLADAEREAIIRVLKYCNGRIRGPQGAADILDIKPTTLEARMKKLGIVKEHIIQ
ncbi:sigma-54 interaction domain-containing protein [Chitinophaga sp. YR573]|uniref:sigma-54 interaction domain-containing protein n=1 Tax=Chitinophaga sp. YR573 TaxID=1881040 RepID=UPI001C42F0BC|nr:sigma 54-interacting transcriptional regulator [Chitinophaga sp. YR573]